VILQDPELGKDARLSADITDPENDVVVLLPTGARLDLKKPHCSAEELPRHYAQAAAEAIRLNQVLHVRLRPFGSDLEMPLRNKDIAMFKDKRPCNKIPCLLLLMDKPCGIPDSMGISERIVPSLSVLCKFGRTLKLRVEQSVKRTKLKLTQDDIVEQLLELLWVAWFFSRSIFWSSTEVANVTANRTLGLGRSFAIGHKLGKKPLHDGICAFCGELLWGNVGSSNGNKQKGPPVAFDGQKLVGTETAKGCKRQPPFLLRFSPELLAYEVPAVFEHDPDSNRLAFYAKVVPITSCTSVEPSAPCRSAS
jgi:hypothetical protein